MANSFVIANGAALSGAVDLGIVHGDSGIVGIVMPAAWTTAAMTFQVSHDGTTYQDLVNDAGTEVNFTVVAAQNVSLRADQRAILSRWRYMKIRSGTTGTPVNQNAARTIVVYVA